ncbi:MAG: ubiquinol-cytochrome C chaperone family protein [Pseudomonadota bacterium]
MILSLFKRNAAETAGEALYAAIVEQARTPKFYAEWGVPDTTMGRFEMVALHAFLVIRRLSAGDRAAKKVSQNLLDAMFRNLDHTLRELGVGDLSVAKKMRNLAENFYGRSAAYEDALKEDDDGKLQEALMRNVYTGMPPTHAPQLTSYVRALDRALGGQPLERLASGIVQFAQGEGEALKEAP